MPAMCHVFCTVNNYISPFFPFRQSWSTLLEHVEAREQKLAGAGEIHRFNRDVEDALSRIQEKYASIPEDLGRDTKAVLSYQKKHEGFENELVALEAQVFIPHLLVQKIIKSNITVLYSVCTVLLEHFSNCSTHCQYEFVFYFC